MAGSSRCWWQMLQGNREHVWWLWPTMAKRMLRLSDKVDEIVWIKLGQLGQLIKTFKKFGVSKALMAGSIAKKKMFEMRPDFKGLAIMTKLAIFHDDDILRSVTDEFAKEGVEIVSSTLFMPELLAPEGCLTKRQPTRSEWADIRFGWKIAKELGRLDIGQSVVVRKRTGFSGGGPWMVLMPRFFAGALWPRKRLSWLKSASLSRIFDLTVPCVGKETISVISRVKGAVLAVEAGRTLMFDRSEMVKAADREKIAVVAVESSPGDKGEKG